MKLNLGCGKCKLDGFINWDKEDLDLNSLPYKKIDDNSVDVIYLDNVFEHLDVNKRLDIINEFGNKLKTDGKLIIVLPYLSSGVHHNTYYHTKGYFNPILNTCTLPEKYTKHDFYLKNVYFKRLSLKCFIYRVVDFIRLFFYKSVCFEIIKRNKNE